MALLSRFRGGHKGVPRPRPRRIRLSPGAIRRERRALLRLREERLRDLGGLLVEMYRRDGFREDLLIEQCEELVGLDARLYELDVMLEAASGRAPTPRCLCGAPLLSGSRFCANCGRPASTGPPAVPCRSCGAALPAEARFCGACGTEVEVALLGGAPPTAESGGNGADPEGRPRGAVDPWEG